VAGKTKKVPGIVHEFMHIPAVKDRCSAFLDADKIKANQ
jgi:hypothetical protein